MYFRPPLVLLIVMLSGACVSVPSGDLHQYLDADSAVVVTGLNKPLELQRDRSQLGANARDFIHAGPIEINRSGQYTYYLWLGIWSTIDDPATQAHRDGFQTVFLLVDGEPMELRLTAWNFTRQGGMTRLYDKPVGSADDAIYAVTVDQLSRMSRAGRLQLVTSATSGQPYTMEHWDAGAMISFAAYVRGEALP